MAWARQEFLVLFKLGSREASKIAFLGSGIIAFTTFLIWELLKAS